MYEQIGERYGVDVVQVSESTMEMLAGPGYELREAFDQDLKAGSVLLVEAEYYLDNRLDSLRIVDSAYTVRSIEHVTWQMCQVGRRWLDDGVGEHYEVWQVMPDETAYVGDALKLAEIFMDQLVASFPHLAKAS